MTRSIESKRKGKGTRRGLKRRQNASGKNECRSAKNRSTDTDMVVVVVAVGIMVDEAAMVAVDECIDQSLHLIRVAMVLICECIINLTRERKSILLYFYLFIHAQSTMDKGRVLYNAEIYVLEAVKVYFRFFSSINFIS